MVSNISPAIVLLTAAATMSDENGGTKEKATLQDYLKEQGLPHSKFTEMRGTENSPASELATRMIDKVFFAVPRWFRENIVKPNQKESAWYHRQYRRVPTIDECYTHDHMCM